MSPPKQMWKSGPPTDAEIRSGKRGFRPAIVSRIESLAADTGLFPLFVGPRTAGASTEPRCYLFFSEGSFQRDEIRLACIGGSASNTRLIVNPIGRGENRVALLSTKWSRRFVKSDHRDWQHIVLDTSDDWTTALHVMKEIRSGYQEVFNVS